MKNNLPAHLRFIAIYQIIGGVLGLIIICLSLFSVLQSLLFLCIGAIFFLYSVFCGIMLFKDRSFGITLTVINLVLQVVSFQIAGYAFKYSSGLSFTVLIDIAHNNLQFLAELSAVKILLMGEKESSYVGINLVPVFVMIYMDVRGRKIEREADTAVQLDIEKEKEIQVTEYIKVKGGADTLYKRFWFEFDIPSFVGYPMGIGAGCGVTAIDYNDAVQLMDRKIFFETPRPPFRKVIENVDIRELDQGHVTPNMYPPNIRGIWFPTGYDAATYSS